MKRLSSILFLAASAIAAAAIAQPAPEATTEAEATPVAALADGHPCGDFYGSICDGHEAPGAAAAQSGPQALAERNRSELKALLERKDPNPSPSAKRVTDFYSSCMDETRLNALGMAPISAELERIDTLTDKAQLPAVIAHLEELGVPALVTLITHPDPRRGGLVLPILMPGASALPDPNLYTDTDARSIGLRGRYLSHVEKIFELLGDDPRRANAEASAVLRVETALVRASRSSRVEQSEDPYRELRMADLAAVAKAFDWPAYFVALGVNPPPTMVVTAPDFLHDLGSLLLVANVEQIKSYLRWQLIHAHAELLPKPFAEATFSFFGSVLADVRQVPPRWQQCLGFTESALPQDLGHAYAEQHLSEASRKGAVALVESLEHALEAEISKLSWMDEASRTQAVAKVRAIHNRIGYPEHWPLMTLRIQRGDALGNWQRSRSAELHRMIASLGKSPDRDAWSETPAGTNAMYDPTENALEVPAGLLQAPAYVAGGDAAVNLGGVGVIVGRELTRSIDLGGRQIDSQGHLHDWWSRQTTVGFSQRAECFGQQLDQFEREDDEMDQEEIEAERSSMLQEILGDAGGLRLAQQVLRGAGGATDSAASQRLFSAFAALSCGTMDRSGDPGVARLRVDAVLSNFSEFASSYSCPAGAPMVHTPACKVW
jgi:putative endopeptidase